jgi:hypothetical protein
MRSHGCQLGLANRPAAKHSEVVVVVIVESCGGDGDLCVNLAIKQHPSSMLEAERGGGGVGGREGGR